MKKSRRGRRFIDRPVQMALVYQVLKHWLLLLFVAFTLLSLLSLLFGDSQGPFVRQIEMVWSRHAMFLVIALLITPIYIHDVICLSHRFVGPVLRVRQELQRIAKGESVRPIVLRKNDFWQELATDFNKAFATVSQKEETGATPLHNDQQSPVDQSTAGRDSVNQDSVKQDSVDQDSVDQEAQLVNH